MLLNKQERMHKRYVNLQEEWGKLLNQTRSLPWVEVKPYQDGWTIYMDFRDDIKRRADYPSLKRALDLVSVSGNTRNPKLVKGIRANRKPEAVYALFNPKNIYSGNEHHQLGDAFNNTKKQYPYGYYRYNHVPVLGRLTVAEWEKQPTNVQRWFYKVEDTTKYWGPREWYQAAFPRYWMIVKTKPRVVTHHRTIDPLLQQRLSEVSKELDVLRYEFGGHYWNSGYTYYHRFGRRAYRAAKRAAIQKFMKGEAEDFEIKKGIKSYNYD